MEQNALFSILDSVESTNNYATAQAHAGMATPGQSWFAKEQYAGKGQRGKSWKSTPGQNIILSIAICPNHLFKAKPFILSALIANVCRNFLMMFTADQIKIKWPNDIYWHDGKAGGILIENIYKGNDWLWAIAGIGININETKFNEHIKNGISLKLITGKSYDVILLAKQLHEMIVAALNNFSEADALATLTALNDNLYKKGEIITVKKASAIFETKIKAVNEYGQLLTEDVIERVFDVGEIAFVFKAHF